MADPITAHPKFTELSSWWSDRLAALELIQPIEAWWSLKVGELGAIATNEADINQGIKIILSTAKGSDVHRPEFASDLWRYIDYPVPRATPFVVRESVTAIALWEPRVNLDSVVVEPYNPVAESLTVTVAWSIGENVSETTEVALG